MYTPENYMQTNPFPSQCTQTAAYKLPTVYREAHNPISQL